MNKPVRVDAHQHFWRLARGDYRWLRAGDAALAPIRRDYEPAHLLPHAAAHGVVRTVLVQAADSVAETEHLLALASAHELVGAVVGWVDLADPASAAQLERWARHPKFRGVRPMLQDLPDDNWIATAPHPAVMQAVLALGLRFDALVKPRHLPALLRFVERWPQLPVVIDHAAKPELASGLASANAWRDGMAALARHPQLHCKISGLLTECAGAARAGGDAGFAALQPVLHDLLGWFSAGRLIWGSDWPVLELAAGYADWVALSDRLLAGLAAPERAAICHDNAVRFYALAG
jgi:L-fuconolactonase